MKEDQHIQLKSNRDLLNIYNNGSSNSQKKIMNCLLFHYANQYQTHLKKL